MPRLRQLFCTMKNNSGNCVSDTRTALVLRYAANHISPMAFDQQDKPDDQQQDAIAQNRCTATGTTRLARTRYKATPRRSFLSSHAVGPGESPATRWSRPLKLCPPSPATIPMAPDPLRLRDTPRHSAATHRYRSSPALVLGRTDPSSGLFPGDRFSFHPRLLVNQIAQERAILAILDKKSSSVAARGSGAGSAFSSSIHLPPQNF